MVSEGKRDRAAYGFVPIKQRQNAAGMREEAAMFGQVIARHCTFPLLYGFFVKTMRRSNSTLREQRHRFLVNAPVAAGQDRLAVAAVAAVPGGDDPARAFDDRNQGGDIPAA